MQCKGLSPLLISESSSWPLPHRTPRRKPDDGARSGGDVKDESFEQGEAGKSAGWSLGGSADIASGSHARRGVDDSSVAKRGRTGVTLFDLGNWKRRTESVESTRIRRRLAAGLHEREGSAVGRRKTAGGVSTCMASALEMSNDGGRRAYVRDTSAASAGVNVSDLRTGDAGGSAMRAGAWGE